MADLPQQASVIRLKNLKFWFPESDSPVIDDVSLDIRHGEVVVITGPSGCGKSTLALAIGGFIPHVIDGRMEGLAEVCGKNTRDVPLAEMATMVGLVQQDPEAQLCTLTVEDEVAFGPENLGLPPEEVRRRTETSLAMAEASHLRNNCIFELSGGEKQRVAIASMLAMSPGVLILDEPTSSLDPEATTDIFHAIRRLKERENMTILVIEHKLDRVAGLADRMIVMERGKVIFDGEPEATARRYIDRIRAGTPAQASGKRVDATDRQEETIRVEGLHFGYDGREVLRGVDFAARRGEIVGIMGRNGSGKTTFLGHITGINKPGKGTVKVMGRDTRRLKVTEISRYAGFVFQNPNHQIFERTVRAEAGFACRNFGYPAEKERIAVNAVLDRYDLSRYSDRHPLKLSFGEKRRLNLSSVLPYDPQVLILDEPLVGQDLVNAARMTKDLRELSAEGKTVIFVTHDADVAYQCCDRIVFFNEGQIIVNDRPGEAFRALSKLGFTDYLPGGFA
ncbi:ABC transporter ATP-binding protein [Methanocella arvoryzae]|uniref:ABC-type cobalt import system, ATPase component n=1 Tax=Methanocella arvoryzae (strain DSM 22066 / NBRC 105507 / MRE50) TaxID=351160 RepID=Q0W8J4_METAR|nr:ABC transporter ATP-binding protein [Methanocella arvoryzae]CAJ35299.1 putative ABC-type cobalt import system, ATPase component [Methanocella arvoryzae MRE50]